MLNVAENCNDRELRKAYKVAALKYHPDKNPGRVEKAQEEFKGVPEAYEILSDLGERSHYESNREEILRRPEKPHYRRYYQKKKEPQPPPRLLCLLRWIFLLSALLPVSKSTMMRKTAFIACTAECFLR